MFIRPAITNKKLQQVAFRLINTVNAEKVFNFEQIQTWRKQALNDPVQAIGFIADELKALRVETLMDYELKTVNNTEKGKDKANDHI
ncbi:hypothetical protein [Methanobrevibacter sp.]|uniref:hypothetical protein n=1 Tax=Methanobrevibacter sp. TaxID=66852 RepID=UPI00386DDD83